jgi:hypothetical protein
MDLIEQAFSKWTEGLSGREVLAAVFAGIRDIPYYVDPGHFSVKKGASRMLADGRGSCFPKHYLLRWMCDKLGFKTANCLYGFYWKDLKLDYPYNILSKASGLPVTYHLACRVFLDGKWVLLDATWDTALGNAGFPVNAVWDGKSDTVLGVTPLKEEHSSGNIDEIYAILRKKFLLYSEIEKRGLEEFTGDFNRWLEQVRKR